MDRNEIILESQKLDYKLVNGICERIVK